MLFKSMTSNKSLMRRIFALALACAAVVTANAQLRTPAASPHSTLKQTVGLTEVEIDYSRPSMKGREIFGGLVPYGEVWRTGANQPTKITFSDDVVLGGEAIEAGTYALYTIPNEGDWTVIVYGKTDLWGSFGYDKNQDVARFSVTPETLGHEVESFTIGIDSLRNDSATIYLDWDTTRVAFSLEVPTEAKVMSQIEALKGTPEFDKPNVKYAAGTYYHAAGKNLKQAHALVSEAIEGMENPGYWMYAAKARIEVDLGKKKLAKESAEKTLELATKANNGDYQKIAKDILASL